MALPGEAELPIEVAEEGEHFNIEIHLDVLDFLFDHLVGLDNLFFPLLHFAGKLFNHGVLVHDCFVSFLAVFVAFQFLVHVVDQLGLVEGILVRVDVGN